MLQSFNFSKKKTILDKNKNLYFESPNGIFGVMA